MHTIKSFPQWLRVLMRRRGVTQQKLADEIEVARATINKWFNGATPQAGHLNELANYFKVPLDSLLGLFPNKSASFVNKEKFADFPQEVPADEFRSAAGEYGFHTPTGQETLLDTIMNTKQEWTTDKGGFNLNTAYTGKRETKLKKALDTIILKGNSGDMQIELSEVLDAVRKKASEPGQKAALARYCGATPQQVSAWLSGTKEPGGKYTVKLASWVGWLVRK
ncbi:MAG TPA: helix-turn-helix transcriptional regulator [Candidatus Angelobacter sp.]|nr:helix-turn-helix transcriptional regulator [Candidatus Angelobacter sp.]